MSKVLRLRQGIMRAGEDVVQQLELLRGSHSTLMVIFRAAVRTAGEAAPGDRVQLINRVAQLAALDGTPFLRVAKLVKGQGDVSSKEAEQLLFATLAGMEQLTAWLDAHEPD